MDEPKATYKAKLKTFLVVREAAPTTLSEPIITPAKAADYLMPFFLASDAGREHFGVLFLNARHRPIAAKIMFSGGLKETAVFPAEIAKVALLLGAAAVIVAHNHPSGDLAPSPDDHALTRRLKEGLALLDIRLLDSLVLGVESAEHRSLIN